MESSSGMLPERKRPVINDYNKSITEKEQTRFLCAPVSTAPLPPGQPGDEVYVHKLRVGEAKSTDAGRNIVRIDASSLILLGFKTGDVLVIAGANGFRAAALCLDSEIMENEPVIRMDRVMRTNLGLLLGDHVLGSSIKALPITADADDREVILDPLVSKVPSALDEAYMIRALKGMPLVAGQAIVVPYFGGVWYPFIVLRVIPTAAGTIMDHANQSECLAVVGPGTRLLFGASGLLS